MWLFAFLGTLLWIPGIILPEFGFEIPMAYVWEVRWLSMAVAGFAVAVPPLRGPWFCLMAILIASVAHNSVDGGEHVHVPVIHIEEIAAALLVAAPVAGALQLFLGWRASRHARKDERPDCRSEGYYQTGGQIEGSPTVPTFPSEALLMLRAARSWLELQYRADESHNALHTERPVVWPMAERLLNEFLEEHPGVAARLQNRCCFEPTATEPVGSSFVSRMLPYGSPRVRRLEKAIHFTAAAAVAE